MVYYRFNRMKNKAGSIISLSVLRANGEKEIICESLHNVMNASILLASSFSLSANITLFVSSYNQRFRSQIDGKWSQSGDTITRNSGSGTIPATGNTILQFEDGDWSYRVSGSGTSATVYHSRTKANLDLYLILSNALAGVSTNRKQNQNFSNVAESTYSNGVYRIKTKTGGHVMPPASSPYILRALTISTNAFDDSNRGFLYDLPSDININIGDSIVIDSFEFTYEYDEYQPRVLLESPLTGVSTSCRAQRMIPAAGTQTAENVNPNRIWLINDGDEYPLPDMVTSSVNPSVLTVLETIVAAGSWSNPSFSNGVLESNSCYGTVATGGSTIKQIAWGDTSRIFGILEFDTPQNIPAGKVITIGGNKRTTPVIPPP